LKNCANSGPSRLSVFLLLLVPVTLVAHADELTRKLAASLPQAASAFARESVKLVGEETLHQVYVTEVSSNPNGTSQPRIEEHTVVSRYTFVSFRESPEALRELRQVRTIDGKPAKALPLDAVAAAVTANDERQKRKVLEDFEKIGLKGVAAEIGQLLLLFNGRKIQNYEFSLQSRRFVGADPLLVFSYNQIEGAGSMTVFRDKDVLRPKLSGEVWVDGSFQPLKVTLATVVDAPDGKGLARHQMEVSYAPTAAGNLMPTRARYLVIRDGARHSETEYEYRNFVPWDVVKK
jgi:hypothetical protein